MSDFGGSWRRASGYGGSLVSVQKIPVGSTYDAATTAWINAVVAAGGTVSDTRKTQADTLILALKAHSLFASLDRLWFLAFADEHTKQAQIDLVNLQSWTSSGGFTLNSNGFTGNGTTGFLDTNYATATNGVNYTTDSAAFGVYIFTSRTTDLVGCAMGCSVVTDGGSRILPLFGGGLLDYTINSPSGTQVANGSGNAQGFWVTRRTGANATAFFRNGSSISTDTPASQNLSVTTFYIGAENRGGFNEGTTDALGAALFGTGFDATQMANLSTDINACMTSLGKNVY